MIEHANDRYPGYKKVDIPSLDKEREALRKRVVGQEEAVGAFASLFVRIKSGVYAVSSAPIDTKYLAGPSGVGKTELVYALAELLADGDLEARNKVLKINGGDYQPEQKHNLSRLFGVPPGYRGAEDPANPGSGSKVIFSEQNLDAHRIPYTDVNGKQKSVILVLIDEAEKADRTFHMAFLSILDNGEADLANNTKADFRDAVIFYTSNVGNVKAEQRHQERTMQTDIPAAFQEAVEDVAFRGEDRELIIREFTQAFPPEFRGRVQNPIVFNHLSREAVGAIAKIKVREIETAFAASGVAIELDLSPEVYDWLIINGYSRSEGARGMNKLVNGQIMEQLLVLNTAREIDILATGIHRKRIGVGISEEGSDLEFYFGEGFQLSDPFQKTTSLESILPVIINMPASIITDRSQKPPAEQYVIKPAQSRQDTPVIEPPRKYSPPLEVGDTVFRMERAKDIFVDDFFGPDQIANTFGFEVSPDLIPDIPFSDQELRRAKELGQFLILRFDKEPGGRILTAAYMKQHLQRLSIRQLQPFWVDPNQPRAEDQFINETPRTKWALVSGEVMQGSTGKNYLEQTQLIADYIKEQVFRGQPEGKYKAALEEFEREKVGAIGLMGDDWQSASDYITPSLLARYREQQKGLLFKANEGEVTHLEELLRKVASSLVNLEINKLTRYVTPVEVLYDMVVRAGNQKRGFLIDKSTWTTRLTDLGYIVAVGDYVFKGVGITYLKPDQSADFLGVNISR